MSFQLNDLKQPAIEAEFKPHDGIADGQGLTILVNSNLLNLARMEETETEFRQAFESIQNPSEGNKQEISIFHFEKLNIRFKARMLGGKQGEDNPDDRYIKDWKLFDKTKKVPINYEIFLNMDKNILDALYNFVVSGAGQEITKKK